MTDWSSSIPLSVKKRRAEKVAQARARFGKQVLRELLHNLAIRVGLPRDVVKKIRNELLLWFYERRTLIGNRRLVYKPGTFTRAILPWAGTQRMVNRQYLVHRFWSYEGGPFNPFQAHMFAIQFPQPIVF